MARSGRCHHSGWARIRSRMFSAAYWATALPGDGRQGEEGAGRGVWGWDTEQL